MSDWQSGIERLNPNFPVSFSFTEGATVWCNNPQLFKALGIYDQVQADIMRGYEGAQLKYWGIPYASEDHGYYNASERPQVTVISKVETLDDDGSRQVVISNDSLEVQTITKKTSDATTLFKQSDFSISASMEINVGTVIDVVSVSTKSSFEFASKSTTQSTVMHSQDVTTDLKVSPGCRLVRTVNPTKVTTFAVRVRGKFCLNCDPKFNNHFLWMPTIDETYQCQVRVTDVGAEKWVIERIPA